MYFWIIVGFISIINLDYYCTASGLYPTNSAYGVSKYDKKIC